MNTVHHSYFIYRTPMGRITIACDGSALTHVAFGVAEFEGEYKACALTNKASSQVLEYLAHKRTSFSLPLNPIGSAFQKKVWEYVLSIPYGQTRTYAQVASDLGIPKGLHAISSACSHNPLPFFYSQSSCYWNAWRYGRVCYQSCSKTIFNLFGSASAQYIMTYKKEIKS